MTNSRRLFAFGTLLIVAALGWASTLHAVTPSSLSRAVSSWLDMLDGEQRDEAVYSFRDEERFDLRLAPIRLEGLRREQMSEPQWQAWLAALGTTLSESGLEKVETIMSLEREVRQRDGEGWSGPIGSWIGGFVHGEGRYYASVYGAPSEEAPWGMRFDGHHLSLNWTVDAEGHTSVTPFFIGGEPRVVEPQRERAGLRVLAEEEDLGFALWSALNVGQRDTAELPFSFATGIAGGSRSLFLGAGARVEAGAPAGIARADLDPEQRALLDALVHTYLSNFNESLLSERWAAIDAADRNAIHFAWAGFLEPGHAGYYRVQGPTFLIEFDNTTEAADHVHAILREWEGDFGRDLLAEHYASEHDHEFALR
jgi:hypothetical protein